jgi:hypothetical protein
VILATFAGIGIKRQEPNRDVLKQAYSYKKE